MPAPTTIARALAATFLTGELEVEALIHRAATLLGKRYRWLRTLATRVRVAFAHRRPRLLEVAQFIDTDRSFLRACETYELQLVRFPPRPTMLPVPAAAAWNLPALRTSGELAAWLQLTVRDLEWFADCRGLCADQSCRLQHYHYRALSKRGGQVRLIEAPKERLKALQRQLLIEILEPVPIHAAVHGFHAGRSIQTFAAPHVGQNVVLKLDLQNFFPTIRAARINSLFRTLGYPDAVATLLTGLCTNVTPSNVWESIADISRKERWQVAAHYGRRHLPQGAPTSPALANLCAYRLDCRLAELANRAEGRYTRYADDLAFSGGPEFARSIKRFHIQACVIAMEEGFAVQHRKTRVMRPGVRQKLAGLVINEKLNIRRNDYDLLKAILTNCVRHGGASQNREGVADFRAHLLGRISFVTQIHPQRGVRLRELFNRIVW